MDRRSFIRAVSLAAAGAAVPAVSTEARAELDADRGATPEAAFEIVARFDEPGPSGVAVTAGGRIFVSFPRHAIDHDRATLGVLGDGAVAPFPDAATNALSDRPAAERLVSVHGITTDASGRLWVIDDGKRAGHPIPDGGAKVVGFDPETGKTIASVVLRPPAMLPDSHMHDLRVDLTHGAAGTAYVTDSSFGDRPAVVVVDLATGAQRRVLADHPSTQPERGFMGVLEGVPHVWKAEHATFPTGGADGITMSPDQGTLFYAPLSSRKLYSVPTMLLSDPHATEAELAAAVRDEGEKGFADGLCTDARGRIYTTNAEQDAVLRRETDGSYATVLRDPRIVWPDGVYATDTHVYVVCGQWNRLPAMNGGVNLRQPPYLLARAPLDPAPVLTSPKPE